MTAVQLQAFVTVAQLNSFTSAAITLGMTQSAVSHAVKSLEKELETPLFIRGKAEISLTETGENILKKAHTILSLNESIRQTAFEARNLKKGVLRIGSFGPSFSANLLPKILNQYQKRFPNITIYVEEGEDENVKNWIEQRKVDLGCIVLPENDLEHLYLCTDKLSVVLPMHHPLASQQSIELKDLSNLTFILTEGSTGKMVMDMFKTQDCIPNILYSNIQIMSMLSLVSEGAGVSIAADLALPKQHNANQYITRPLMPTVNRDIALAMHSREHLSPAAEAFVSVAVKLQRAGKLAF